MKVFQLLAGGGATGLVVLFGLAIGMAYHKATNKNSRTAILTPTMFEKKLDHFCMPVCCSYV
jgi:hypothetical protein